MPLIQPDAILPTQWPARGAVRVFWIVALPLMLLGLGGPTVQRTQEARVLETAREMLDAPASQWMVPRLNTEIRVEKPPLAYWMAAGSFKLFGVNEFAGRLPFVLAGWLSLAVVYQIGLMLIGARAGLFAAGAMLSSYMFFRYTRLAETDVTAMLFVSSAIWFFLRAAGARWLLNFQLAGLCMGLATLTKGLPAVFAMLFFVAWVVVEKRWTLLKQFAISGGWLTAMILGGFWYVFIRFSPAWPNIVASFKKFGAGEDHGGPFYSYFHQMLIAPLPWTGFVIAGAIWMWHDVKARPILIWASAVIGPLSIAGNKQFHYLVALMPPMMLMAGYAIDRGLAEAQCKGRSLHRIAAMMMITTLIAGIGALVAARMGRGFFVAGDFALVALVVFGSGAALMVWRRNDLCAGLLVYIIVTTLMFAMLIGRFLPSLTLFDHRDAAAEIVGKHPGGRYCFYGKNVSFGLLFHMRTIAPQMDTLADLQRFIDADQDTIVLTQTKNKVGPPVMPAGLVRGMRMELGGEGMIIEVWRRDQTAPSK